jgi:hypothetical protein
VDLTAAEVEVDAVVRDDGAEPLRDAAELECELLVWRRRRCYLRGSSGPAFRSGLSASGLA